ncbi:PREDICTED: proline-rich protein 22 [Chaetura pelagica]|uniref:proline-rich protein 22 n=1 Tax=Chaetura pelagica TaxID=8897 RepID=UPI000523E61C|nr:PREDICTED: proline-rich protein 22 [Chaetura pelagica]
MLPETCNPRGLQRAPCGCFFDPRLFHIQWTTTNLPPPATSTPGHCTAALPGAVLGGLRGWVTPLAWTAPRTSQQDIQGQAVQLSIPDTATPTGPTQGWDVSQGNNVPPGGDVPPSSCAGPHIQALGDPASDTALVEETLLGCSLVSQDRPSSVPVPGDSGGAGRAAPPCDFASLSLPDELLYPDYSVPETANSVLSLAEFVMELEPQEPWGDLSPPQPGRSDIESTGA